jgi:hypothetical protein
MIVNDAHFQLYRLFKETAPKLANKFLKRYRGELKKGVNTIYLPLEIFYKMETPVGGKLYK